MLAIANGAAAAGPVRTLAMQISQFLQFACKRCKQKRHEQPLEGKGAELGQPVREGSLSQQPYGH